MGDDGGLDDEKPVHNVVITKPFYLGICEVTIEQFRQFVEATGYTTDAEKGRYDAEYYAKSPTNDPWGPTIGEERMYRGGGWFNCARGCRSASRNGGLSDNRHLTLGFRVAIATE